MVIQVTVARRDRLYVARMEKTLGAKIEDGYRKLNSLGSKKPMSLDDWVGLIFPLIALSVPRITGIRDSIAVPVSLFGLFAIYTLVWRRADSPKRFAVAAGGCLLLYLVLILPHHR